MFQAVAASFRLLALLSCDSALELKVVQKGVSAPPDAAEVVVPAGALLDVPLLELVLVEPPEDPELLHATHSTAAATIPAVDIPMRLISPALFAATIGTPSTPDPTGRCGAIRPARWGSVNAGVAYVAICITAR